MAVKTVKLTQEVEYGFGTLFQGSVFTVVSISKDKTATVMVLGKATLVLPPGSYEIIE